MQAPAPYPHAMSNCDVALRLARAGYFVFPCDHNKKPRVKWREASTTDELRIGLWWQQWPDAVPAIDSGKSKIVVIDVDCHEGGPNGLGEWKRLTAEHGHPIGAPMTRTPSGGLHIYFRQPSGEPFTNRTGDLPDGIDIRAAGGYAIAPGAVLPDGRGWQPVVAAPALGELQPPPLPEWCAEIIKAASPGSSAPAPHEILPEGATPYGASVLAARCEEISACRPGAQSNTLVQSATRIGSLVAGGEIAYAHAREKLIAAASRMSNGDARNPWTLPVIEDQVTRALAHGAKSPNCAPNRELPQIDTSKITAKGAPLNSQPALETVSDASSHNRYRLLDGAAIEALEPTEWRVKGVFPAKGLCAFYGPSASGKSFLAFDLGTAIANGSSWFGYRMRKGAVVYVALEGAGGFRLRVWAWVVEYGAVPASLRLVLNQSFNITNANDVRDLAAVVIATFGPDATVFIDTMNRAAPGLEENNSKDMGLILSGAKSLQEAIDGLVILVHHTGKDAAKGLRGHSSLFAALDGAIEVTRDSDQRSWRVAKSKDGADGEEHMFSLEVISLGQDGDGDEITSCVVRPEAAARAKAERLSKAEMIALDCLGTCRAFAAQPVPQAIIDELPKCNGDALFPPFAVVPEGVWRNRCYDAGISKGKQHAASTAFNRVRKSLLDKRLVLSAANHFWLPEWQTPRPQ